MRGTVCSVLLSSLLFGSACVLESLAVPSNVERMGLCGQEAAARLANGSFFVTAGFTTATVLLPEPVSGSYVFTPH
jgi:hypothetical protein